MGRGWRGLVLLLAGTLAGMAAVPSTQAQALPVEAFAKASPFSMPHSATHG